MIDPKPPPSRMARTSSKMADVSFASPPEKMTMRRPLNALCTTWRTRSARVAIGIRSFSYTFFAGRYLNPMLPSLAAAAGLTIASLEKRFGAIPAISIALIASVQPLFHGIQVDRLFGQKDTRTLAREWTLENVPPGRTVALQSYSVPLPQSAESLRESLEARGALAELERRGRYENLLRAAEKEKKSYRLIFLGKGDGSFLKETETPEVAAAGGRCRGYDVKIANLDADPEVELVAAFAGEPSALFAPTLCLNEGSLTAWKARRKMAAGR